MRLESMISSPFSRPLRAWRSVCQIIIAMICLATAPATAAYTETAPQGVFLFENSVIFSRIQGHWHDDGSLGSLLEPVERYEVGGGLQGVLIADVDARFRVVVPMLLYGITDDISAFVGVPVVLLTSINPDLDWIPGDFSPQIGRAYSEDDFWEWAGSMGQPKPGPWEGNRNTLSDTVIGGRWRFSDRIRKQLPDGLHLAVSAFAALPTGEQPDPEEIVAVGTDSWSLHSQGELGLHLSADYDLMGLMDERVLVGADVFYEAFLPRTYYSSTGEIHPLLLNERPYVGETYRMNPGDFAGIELTATVTAIRGPARETWLTRRAPGLADSQPPLLRLSFTYGFTGVMQSRWYSESEIWNWDQERFWAPGYKNILGAQASISLLRLGVPLDIQAGATSLNLLPGRNVRAPEMLTAAVRVPMKFW